VERRQPGQRSNGSDAQFETADLALLHALISHHARLVWDIQRSRIALSNRAGAMQRDGLAEQWALPLITASADLAATEHAVDLHLQRLVRQHPLRAFIESAPGIGLRGFGRLLGATGSLDRFATVSRLWAYLGMHVVDGAAPRRRRGQRAKLVTTGTGGMSPDRDVDRACWPRPVPRGV
jgi:hypothetical protein